MDKLLWRLSLAIVQGDGLALLAFIDYNVERGVPREEAEMIASAYVAIIPQVNRQTWIDVTSAAIEAENIRHKSYEKWSAQS